jgi:probable H4MPT-linked C1 transfer pathway protein
MNWLALDIGGANLKAADGGGWALWRPFPLWQRRDELPDALADLVRGSPPADALAVTMTGELADCFSTKAEGVATILAAVAAAACGRAVWVYRVDGSWAEPKEALRRPLLAAASNWHALACFAGRYAPQGTALAIDVGSTTCDLIPLRDGQPAARGRTDPERLVRGELVYTGVQRSPISAVAPRLPWRGHPCPTAQELFATTWDVYLLLGDLPEEAESTHTADGRPATRRFAHERLARAICADREMVGLDAALEMARAAADAQLSQLAAGARKVVRRMPHPPGRAVISGSGEFLARRLLARLGLDVPTVSLGEQLGPALSRAATAHALAVLARERMRDKG